MHQYLLSFVRTLSEQQLLNAVQLITSESRESYLNDGLIFMMHNLRRFEREPFVLIADEFHAKWYWHEKWKLLAIAGFNLDGSNLHYLHMKLALVEDKAM
ncbi:GL23388 [Drosophila persimilis]|uniref:GL23388 n=1 Tax=Drosophila persimilis TaxID=7234 RepID=B4G445_DROPE|nr:GL23388 [Drosophila persimilis]